jgi:hypothetical protein
MNMLLTSKRTIDTPLGSNSARHSEENEKLPAAVPFGSHNNNNNTLTTEQSPKLGQSILVHDQELLNKAPISSQSSISSSSSTNFTDVSALRDSQEDEGSQSYFDNLVKETNLILERPDEDIDTEVTGLIKRLLSYLVKTKNQSNSYKIKSELLSISSKDADMRYEVENDLIKKEVESLKHQSENQMYLMNKISHQKQTLKKYKNEIINKNKEIIELRSKLNRLANPDRRRKLIRSHTEGETGSHGNMLDTLGLLASQVLTEEEQNNHTVR